MISRYRSDRRCDNGSDARRRGFTLFGLLLVITLCCLVLALIVAVREAATHGNVVQDLMITDDGKTIAAVFGDGRVLLFDTDTGNVTGSFAPKKTTIAAAYALSPDGRYLAHAALLGGQPIPGVIWDIIAEKEKTHFGPIEVAGLKFSPDGRLLAVATSVGGTVELVDVATGGQATLNAQGVPFAAIQSIGFSPDGGILAVASSGTPRNVGIELFDIRAHALNQSFTVPGDVVQSLTFLPDGTSLVGFASTIGAAGHTTHALHLWDSRTLDVRGKANVQYPGHIAVMGDGRVAVFGLHDIALYDPKSLKPAGTIGDAHVARLASAPAANLWATTDGASIQLRDSRTGRPIKTIWKARPALSLPLVMAGLVAWFVVFSVYRRRTRAKTQSAACVWCSDVPADRSQPAFVCPACRAKQSSVAEQRAERRGMRMLALLWLGAGGFAAMSGQWQVAIFIWLGAPALLSLLLLLVYRRNLARFRQRTRPAAGFAPDTSGLRQWEVDPRGNVSSMHAPYDAFAEMARTSARRARDYVKSLAGVDLEFPAGLKVVDFPDFDELARRMAMFQTDPSIFACVYVARPGRQIICCEAGVRRQLGVPADRLCAAFTNALVDHRHVMRVPAWLSASLAHWSAVKGRADESQRLHRALSAYLAEGGLLGPEIFRALSKSLAPHVRQTYNHQEFVYTHRFLAQGLSIVDYLASDAAPPERRDAFRSMVADMVTGKPARSLVPRKYGMREEELLADWEAWVRGRAPAEYATPSEAQRQVLALELLPLARDRQVRRAQRLRAIRTMGKGGFPFGADVLIDLVSDRDEDYLLRQTSGWALSMISGRHDRGWHEVDWHAWWAEVPETWKVGVPVTA